MAGIYEQVARYKLSRRRMKMYNGYKDLSMRQLRYKLEELKSKWNRMQLRTFALEKLQHQREDENIEEW